MTERSRSSDLAGRFGDGETLAAMKLSTSKTLFEAGGAESYGESAEPEDWLSRLRTGVTGYAVGALSLTLAFGCGSNGPDEAPAEGRADSGTDDATPDSGRLDPAAAEELDSLGIDDYLGRAAVISQAQNPARPDETMYTFDPASGPMCVDGAPYSVHLRDKGSEDLIIFLQGGGACWTGKNLACSVTPEEQILPFAFMNDDDPNNSFRDWNLLYFPYCDGSVFIGDNDVPDTAFPTGTRFHRGRRNLSAGLDLAREHLPTPKRVLVSGASAGGYGTIGATALVRMVWPDAELFVYNDAGPGVQDTSDTTNIEARINDWRFDEVVPDSCTACEGGRGQLIEVVAWMLENDPTLKVALLSNYEDAVIGSAFLGMPGPDYKALLLEASSSVHERFPERYQRFMIPGVGHVVTLSHYPDGAIEGVTLVEWAEAMVFGGPAWRDLLAPD